MRRERLVSGSTVVGAARIAGNVAAEASVETP